MILIGCIMIVVAVGWISYRVYLSYTSAGGTVIATVYDAAFFPPPLIAGGLYLILPAYGVQWAIWIYIVISLVTAGLVAGGIRLAEEIGDRPP